MAEARVGIKVADDRQTTTIEIGSVGGPSFPVELSLEQLTFASPEDKQIARERICGAPHIRIYAS
jgi:hypothetical protein